MKTVPLSGLVALLAALASAPCPAATLLVTGFLEGDGTLGPEPGDTMDYYKFEVITPGTVSIEALRNGGLFLLAAFIGVEDEFGFIGNPYRLDTGIPCTTPNCAGDPTVFLERFLPAGAYVFVATAGGRSSYDVFDGYVAVNPEGGGFIQGQYQYTITGDVRGLEYWDGHLDRTFTVTQIPEPSVAALAAVALTLMCRR